MGCAEALRVTPSMVAPVPCGINGFGRIGLETTLLRNASTLQRTVRRARTRPCPTSSPPSTSNHFASLRSNPHLGSGRLVARIMIKSPDTELRLINSGADADYMAYQFKSALLTPPSTSAFLAFAGLS